MSATASTGAGRVAGARFIDPAVLARIGNLELLARIVVDGFLSGLHRAIYLGVSTDFAEHRSYSPGDDIRRIDWRLYGRTDRLFVKAFEAETNADLVIAVDASSSMGFSGSDAQSSLSKLEYACFLAATLAQLGKRQRDRVGLCTFDAAVRDYLAPSVRRHSAMLQRLDALEAAGAGDFAEALKGLATRLVRRGVVVVVSDFYETPDTVIDALGELRGRGHEVIAVHVLTPRERRLAFNEALVLEDMETAERLPVDPGTVRAEYEALLAAHVAELAERCGAQAIDYELVETSMPLDHVLFRYLSDRARRSKVR